MSNLQDGGNDMQGKRTNLTKVILEKIYKYGISPVIFALAILLGLVAFNYVAAVRAPSFDVTRNKVNSLSKETLKLLGQLKSNITIKAFYTTNTQRQLGIILDKYIKNSQHIKVEYIDPIKNPIVAEKYEVTYPGTIVIESGEKNTRINNSPNSRLYQERAITTAIYRLMTDITKKAYFTSGHGELSIDNVKANGLSSIKERLEEQNYIVETVNLIEKNGVPKDCSVLIVAGPTVPFSDEEQRIILDYLDSRGSVVFLLGPGITTNLEPIIRNFGILPGNDYIYETSKNMTTPFGGPLAPLCSAKDTTEITQKLENQTFLFPYVRSMSPAVMLKTYTLRRLVASSENSWAETDLESAKTINTSKKPSRDEKELKGPVSVAVIADREFNLPDSLATRDVKTTKVRSAFFGNATFLTNQFVTPFPANMSLFTNTVNWITKNEKIIEITPNSTQFTPVELKDSDRRMISLLTLVVIPFAIFMAGFVVWYRRR
jgi:ABC-type uncharacterized transport system involved in gliding motility auxiliary subunit